MKPPAADRLRDLFTDTVARLDPTAVVAAALANHGPSTDEVAVVAVGKAALGMAAGAARVLGDRLVNGAAVAPTTGPVPGRIELVVSAHPVPDRRSERAGRRVLERVGGVRADQAVVALISGGASALVAVPVAGVSLVDKARAANAVYAAGAPIGELNTVRKHLSAIKGGRLAAACPGPVLTLVLSDVVGDDLSAVGSGPTVADPTTFADACRIVEARVGWGAVPASVRVHLEAGRAGDRPETLTRPRSQDRAWLAAGLATLAATAADAAVADGLAAVIYDDAVQGDVADVAGRVVAEARGVAGRAGRCLIACGEPTVCLPAQSGVGGRAHHLALLIAAGLAGIGGVAVLVAGSDGVDGNTGAAGAVVDGQTLERVRTAGIDPDQALVRCDAGTALFAAGASFTTGPTGVNHADLIVILAGAHP